jgi:anti-sigma B factor antagonist
MNISFANRNGVTIATLQERRLDAAGAPDFKERVGARIDAGAPRLILDLTAVDFVDSTGLSAILSLLKRVSPSGALALAGCRPPVIELLKLTRLDRVIQLYAGTEAAIRGLVGI